MAKTYSDAIALLKADHREVEALFEQYEKASGDSRKQELAVKICDALKIHALIEEEIFYPAVSEAVEEDTMNEAYVEHDGAKVLINDIMNGSPADEYFDAKVKVLSEDIAHHVHEEEARSEGMFSQARQGGVDVAALLERMLARKNELMAQAKAGLPPAVLTVVRA